jgi:hypothetical protein
VGHIKIGETPVRNLDTPALVIKKNIARLYIPVDYALGVSIFEAPQDLPCVQPYVIFSQQRVQSPKINISHILHNLNIFTKNALTIDGVLVDGSAT